MNRLAKILRARRSERGALSLASPEVKFEIDTETHDPLDVGMYQLRDTNQMVEEMMLLANCSVAEATLGAFPACSLLRRHPTPAPRQFEPLLRAAAAAGFAIDASSSKVKCIVQRCGGTVEYSRTALCNVVQCPAPLKAAAPTIATCSIPRQSWVSPCPLSVGEPCPRHSLIPTQMHKLC